MRFVYGVMILIVACQNVTEPITPTEGRLSTSHSSLGSPRSMDQIFTDIAEQVPGFGGFFLDENGDLILFVTDLTRGMAAEQAARDLLESLDPRERPHVHQFRVRKGDYDFRDLLEWRYGLSSVLTIPGVVFTDVDEGLNRVRVGIDNPLAAQSVLQMTLSTGIPLNALVIEDVGPLRTLSTLQDSVRPMEGGIRISSDNHQCTLGFLAERNQVLVFITNSHCTTRRAASRVQSLLSRVQQTKTSVSNK